MTKRISLMCVGLGMGLVCPLQAQHIGQWDFTNGDLSATVGEEPLQYADGPGGATDQQTPFGTTTDFGIPDIGGEAAQVMSFPALVATADYNFTCFRQGFCPAARGYLMPNPPNANGGGGLVNDYTILMDLLYPAESAGKLRPLVQTDNGFFTGAPSYLQIGSNDGIGGFSEWASSDGPYHGMILPDTWHRVGFVLDSRTDLLRKYIDGVEVGSQLARGIDGPFSLVPYDPANTNDLTLAVILANVAGNEAAPGYANSIQLRDEALSAEQMAALGGVTAGGIPQTITNVLPWLDAQFPGVEAVDVSRRPTIGANIRGDTLIVESVELFLDDLVIPANVTVGSNDLVEVRYEVPEYTFSLEETLTLSPPQWSPAPSGNNNPATIPSAGSAKWFRLVEPHSE